MSASASASARNGGLTPEVGATIEAACEELDRAILEARLQDDPIRHALQALATTLRAQHRLYVDGSLTLAQTLREAGQPDNETLGKIEKAIAATRLLSPEAERQTARNIAGQTRQEIAGLAREIRRTIWVGTALGAGLALGIAVFAGRYWGYHEAATAARSTEAELHDAFASGLPSASAWRDLMRLNPRIAESLKDCIPVQQPNGQAACSVALWTSAPPAPQQRPSR